MRKFTTFTLIAAATSLTMIGCQSGPSQSNTSTSTNAGAQAVTHAASVASSYVDIDAYAPQFGRPGYVTFVEDGRLWVFAENSKGLDDYLAHGEPAKQVTWIGEGPNGMSLRSDSTDALLGYCASKSGYRVFVEDGRLWIFQDASESLAEFLKHGEPAKSVTWIGEGFRRATLKSDSADTLLAYMAAKPGFRESIEDGRIWVFKADTDEYARFLAHGEPAKQVAWIGEGPRGATIKSTDSETLLQYLATKPGFEVFIEDGRLWVFREGSDELKQFKATGEPAKQFAMVGAGPRGVTLKSTDRSTIVAYQAR